MFSGAFYRCTYVRAFSYTFELPALNNPPFRVCRPLGKLFFAPKMRQKYRRVSCFFFWSPTYLLNHKTGG